MMMSMNPMEFSPLSRCQRPQNRMVKDSAVPKASLALRNDSVHHLEFLHHLSSHCFRIDTPRHSLLRRLPAIRKMVEQQHHQSSQTLLHCRSSRDGLAGGENAFESFDCPSIGEVQMLQHLCRAPFLSRMPAHLLTRHSLHR